MHVALENVRDKYDVTIIGSGLGGLTAANMLARSGYSVLILEQHYNFGGLATWFRRKGGHIFDVSLHGFPYGMVKSARKYWNQEIVDSIQQLDCIRFDNPQFSFSTTFDRKDFTDKLIHTFNIPAGRIEAFFEEARSMTHLDDTRMKTRDLFQKHFPNRLDVWRLLMEPITYANGSTLDEPALTYGIVFSNFMNKGVFTFRGGTDQLIKKMKSALRSNGVKFCNHTQVEKIVVEKGRAVGVIANGHRVNARAVLSNAGLRSTTDRLIGHRHFTSDFVDQIHSVRLSTSSCQVYMGIRNGETIKDIGELFFTSTHPVYDSDALCTLRPSSRTFSFYYPKTRPQRPRYSIVSSTNARYEDWACLDDTEYRREKKRLANETLSVLARYLPGVREKIDHIEVSTPRTFVRYTQHTNGAVFGTKFEGLAVSMGLSEQVPGAFHTGSVGIIMGGWLGAINYGVITANKIDVFLLSDRRPRPRKNAASAVSEEKHVI